MNLFGCSNNISNSDSNNKKYSQYSDTVRQKLIEAERECCMDAGGRIDTGDCTEMIDEDLYNSCFYNETKNIDLEEE